MAKTKIVIGDWWLVISEKIKKKIKINQKEFIFLLLILALSAFFRLWRISEYMTFLGDEGRDAIIVRRLLVFLDPILIGPGTSIGNMYLGPLYYYFMAPWLFLFGLSPAGPAVGIAVLGVATVFMVWFVSREWFGVKAAWIAAFFYAISPVVITYSHSSWNPNIMPFFAILSMYSLWKIFKKGKVIWYLILGTSFAFVLQSHYLGLLLLPTILVFLLFVFVKIRILKLFENWKLEFVNFLRNTLLAFIIFVGLMSPLAVFDARHDWQNAAAIKKFFLERQTTVSAKPWANLDKTLPIYDQINSSLVGAGDINATYIVTWGSIWTLAWAIYESIRKRKLVFQTSFLLVLAWLGFGIIGLSLYKQQIYDHYFGFLFPAIFIFLGTLFSFIWKKSNRVGKIILVLTVGYLVLVNLAGNPLRYSLNRQLQRSLEVADKIVEESNFARFNIAVIAERNYEDAYQYILEWRFDPVVDIDPLNYEATSTDQLFVVCELQKEKCDPTHNPKTEVANFGWSKIEGEWDVGGVTLYKLVHSL
ncbi:hypothetical protein A3D84_04050 [Candidatus Woesebacteria bacterium RIFCSPHIGHO2_02_FULL_42_20]|nr:MAG: hypothetical protein A3D84_04050 [Candidatus Woesebacteria bacterium RIFCSPHIGHO2_02_FULL_42_20]OGM72201.1 MAG: hypothetical protein A3H21_02625 [Candidatus Woesebacteria bacterium RIFCSPLOWO2_12_FULL_42_8]